MKNLTYSKRIVLLPFFFITGLLFTVLNAQSPGPAVSGSFDFRPAEGFSCITDAQRIETEFRIRQNIQMLKEQGKLLYDEASKPNLVTFDWPLEMADGVPYEQIWGISNFVDQQTGSGILDYNCMTKTYDGHHGTDIYLWPFSWYAMDHDQAEVVAAADGQILYKFDGNDDRSCVMGGGEWNAVYIQQSDGSITWYGHMKKNTLTTKNVGDMVTRGEYLGIVGSSGNSTGPHLHFEVHDSQNHLIDPFQGSCNTLNPDSWWDDQYDHDNPSINAVLTHDAAPVFPECPQQEIPNMEDYFDLGQQVIMAVYLTDQEPGSQLHLRVLKPDGSALYDWNYTLDTYYQASYYYWTVNPDIQGKWKWEVTYKGETETHEFYAGVMDISETEIKELAVYPNPARNQISLQSPDKIVEIQILDAQGRLLKQISDTSGIDRVDIRSLPAGLYLIKTADIHKKSSAVKFMKK